MQYLKEWVAAIAGMVVFASLLELLAPSGSMKRYVQITTGLLILLTLLKPVLGVVKGTRDLVWETEAAWNGSALSLDQVMAQADQIRQAGLERQTRVYRERLEAAAARSASAVLAGWEVRAQVVLGAAESPDQAPPLQNVVLTLTPGNGAGSDSGGTGAGGNAGGSDASGSAAGARTALVAPVEIRLGPAAGGSNAAGDGSDVRPQGEGETSGAGNLDASLAAAARRAVAEALGLAPDQVEIRSESIRG